MGLLSNTSIIKKLTFKIRTSPWYKGRRFLCHDEFLILMFDVPAEVQKSQRRGCGSNTNFGIAILPVWILKVKYDLVTF